MACTAREFPLPAERGGSGSVWIELEESTALFSLSSDGEEERAGERSRVFIGFPLSHPLPARSSRGEGDRDDLSLNVVRCPHPREERAGRGLGRGKSNKTRLLSPALSSSSVGREGRKSRRRFL